MLDKKNVVIVHSKDKSMCGQLRMHAMTQLGMAGRCGDVEFLVSPEVIQDDYILQHTCAVVINRVMGPQSSEFVRYYGRKKKRFNFRVVVDYDDCIWDVDGKSLVPEYNPCKFSPVAVGKHIESCVQYIDEVTVSTRIIGELWLRRFGKGQIVSLVPNYLPRAWYGHNARRYDGDIVKPKVVYGGSPTHYTDKDIGDFDGVWVPWLTEAVKSDKIEIHMFGYELKAPFLSEIKDKVILHEPTSAWEWGSHLRDIGGDIYVAPLKENLFNSCKSNLKLLEASACGMMFLGSSWPKNEPYFEAHPLSFVANSWSPDQMQARVDKMCEKDTANSILYHQDKLIGKYWLEDDKHIGGILKAWMRDFVHVSGV